MPTINIWSEFFEASLEIKGKNTLIFLRNKLPK
jgi:hypothetical protein